MSTWIRTRSVLAAFMLVAGCTTAFEDGDEGRDGNPNNNNNGTGTGGVAGDPTKDPTICVPGVPATSQLPLLTNAQYDNTIRDLLGLDTQPSTMLAPDTGSVDQRAWDGYQLAAETLAAEVLANVDARAKVVPCSDDTPECIAQFVGQLGRRAFRRPLTAEESARFVALYTNRAEVTANGTFDEAVELIINAFLLSPSFLIRAETSEVTEEAFYKLSNHELATRLSYMLWSSMPDDALLDAAAAPEPWTPEQILEHAKRMLADPKARDMLRSFHEHWLHMGPGTRWANITRDPAIFPAFNDTLVPLMSEETERFVEHVVFDQAGTFQQLITSPVGFVNASLAPLYGLDPAQFPSPDLVPHDLDPNTRAGIFTRLGFLASHSLYDRTSPILRGAYIQKEILCTPIAAPPPGAEGTPLPTTADLNTNRKRVDAQTAEDGCTTCHHKYINPTGFPFEAYDAIGAIQVTEKFSGEPLDTTSSVPVGKVEVDVTGPVELSQAIADSPEAHACYARHWVEFAYERTINNKDACTVDDLKAKLASGDYKVLDLVADLTQSQAFRLRAVDAEVAP